MMVQLFVLFPTSGFHTQQFKCCATVLYLMQHENELFPNIWDHFYQGHQCVFLPKSTLVKWVGKVQFFTLLTVHFWLIENRVSRVD